MHLWPTYLCREGRGAVRYIVMACIAMPYIVTAYTYIAMAYVVVAYGFMTGLKAAGPRDE